MYAISEGMVVIKMAWISVHEQVIGGKLRSLAKEIGCSQNEALGILIRLWLWAINNAGKDGCIVGADKDDVAEVLNMGIDRRYSADDVVDALVVTGWIDMENGLYIHDWEEWQEQWYKAIEIREKDAARKRKERSLKRMMKNQSESTVATPPAAAMEDMEEVLPNPKLNIPNDEAPKQQPAATYSNDFEEMWKIYPRKVGKGDAYKKYKARLNDGWSPGELMEAVKNYASKVARERTEQQYIKHAKTFFSDSTPFVDYLPSKEEPAAKASYGNDDDPYADWR